MVGATSRPRDAETVARGEARPAGSVGRPPAETPPDETPDQVAARCARHADELAAALEQVIRALWARPGGALPVTAQPAAAADGRGAALAVAVAAGLGELCGELDELAHHLTQHPAGAERDERRGDQR